VAEKLSEKEEQLVVFDLEGESYGVNIATVQEIIRMQHITRVPRAPEYVKGVTNLRGRVIPVVNLRQRFGLPLVEDSESARIVVVEIGEQTIGMVVDGVSEVLRLMSDSIEPPSPVVTTVASDYLRGIAKLDGRLITLLSLDRLLSHQEFKSLNDVASDTEAA
jgi:purine-binding chemotaxis protein CheW